MGINGNYSNDTLSREISRRHAAVIIARRRFFDFARNDDGVNRYQRQTRQNFIFPLVVLVFPQPFQQGDFLFISRKFVRRFQVEGKVLQKGMIDDAGNGVKAQGALSDFFVPVLMAPQGVLVVVQMDGVKPGKAPKWAAPSRNWRPL